MDGYLRLILLVVAAIIVSFILFESWYRRRQAKLALFSTDDTSHQINADEVLGLDPREPTMKMRMPESDMETHATVQTTSRMQEPPVEITESRSSEAYANKTYTSAPAPKPSLLNDLLVISVVAEPGMQFGSYDLLQAISATGMQFGEMNIFHYKIGNETLFSLSSATEPGDFNLDRMGDFVCEGFDFVCEFT